MGQQANKFNNPYGSGSQFFDPRANGQSIGLQRLYSNGGIGFEDAIAREAARIRAQQQPKLQSAGPRIQAWDPNSKDYIEPSTRQKIAKKIVPYARPLLETGGTLAGSILGAGSGLATGPGAIATSPIGGLLGAGLGHAWGRSVANALEQYAGVRQAPTLIEAARDTGLDILNGASDYAGGEIAGTTLAPVAKGLATKAPRFNKQATRVFPDLSQNPVVDVGSGYAKDKAQAAFEKYQEERRRDAARRRAREAGR